MKSKFVTITSRGVLLYQRTRYVPTVEGWQQPTVLLFLVTYLVPGSREQTINSGVVYWCTAAVLYSEYINTILSGNVKSVWLFMIYPKGNYISGPSSIVVGLLERKWKNRLSNHFHTETVFTFPAWVVDTQGEPGIWYLTWLLIK